MADEDIQDGNALRKRITGMKLSHKPPRIALEARRRIIGLLEDGCVCGGQTATLRKRRIRGGAVNVHLQCDKCGTSLSGAMKRVDHYFWQDYSEWDQALKDKEFEVQHPEAAQAQAVRNEAYEARKRWYNEVFLKSEEWKLLRSKVIDRNYGICEACLTNLADEVHHDGYDHGSLPPAWKLKAVCRECHEKITFGWPMEKLSQFADP